jgi:hypothetical protein
MTVPESSKYILEAGPTNWVGGLAPYYTKRNQQEEKSLSEWKQHRADKVQVQKEESFVRVVGQIADFSSKAATIYQSHKRAAALEEDKKKHIYWSELSREPHNKDTRDYLSLEYKIKAEKLTKNSPEQKAADVIKGRLQEAGEWDALLALDKESPREIIWRQEFWARQMLPELTQTVMERELAKAGKLSDYYDASDQEAFLRNWQDGKLAFLNLSDEFTAAILSPELSRQRQTAYGGNKASAQFAVATFEQQQIGMTMEQLGKNPEGLAVWLDQLRVKKAIGLKDIVDDKGKVIKTVGRQVSESIKKDVEAASYDGHINTSTLQGYLAHLVKHDGFKEGETTVGLGFFTKDDINDMVTAARAGESRAVGVALSTRKAQLPDLKRRALANEDVSSEVALIASEFPELKELTDDILNTNPQAQSQTAEQLADAKYQKLYDEGTLTPEDVKDEPNKAMNDKWTGRAEKLKAFNKNYKTDDYNASLKDGVTQYTRKKSLEPGQTQNKDEQLTTNILQKYGAKLRAEKLANQEKSGKSDRQIFMEVQDEVDVWKIKNGWGTENGPGMFSLKTSWNSLGSTPTWPNLRKIAYKLEEIRAYDWKLGHGNNIEAVYNKTILQYPDRDNRIKQVGGLYTKDMLLAFKQNGYFNKDMKIIAAKNGLLPGTAYKLAVDALSNGTPDDKNWLVAFNFERGANEVTPDVRVGDRLIQAAVEAKGTSKEAAIKQVQSILKWYGFDHLNLPQRKLIYDILAEVSPVTEGLTNPLESKIQELRGEGKTEKEIAQFIENLTKEKLGLEGSMELQRGDLTNVNSNIT